MIQFVHQGFILLYKSTIISISTVDDICNFWHMVCMTDNILHTVAVSSVKWGNALVIPTEPLLHSSFCSTSLHCLPVDPSISSTLDFPVSQHLGQHSHDIDCKSNVHSTALHTGPVTHQKTKTQLCPISSTTGVTLLLTAVLWYAVHVANSCYCLSVCFVWVQPRPDILWMQLLTDSTRGGLGGGVVPWLQIESQSTFWASLKRSDRWIPV